MYGSVRSQLMQVYVQKSTSTAFPARLSAVRRGELSHSPARPRAVNSRDAPSASAGLNKPECAAAIVIAAVPRKRRRSWSIC